MKLLLENWKRYLAEGPVEKYKVPGSDKYSGNWEDTGVAYKDSDLNFNESTEDFVLILDKLAELLNLSEPIITSGLRLPKRQVGPMVYLWNPHAIPSDVFDASADYIGAQGGISAHQHGKAVDYGLLSNNDEEIIQMLEYIKGKDLVNMEVIDERGIAAAHWHISVYGINTAGKEFLETPNEQIQASRSPE